MSDDQPRCVGEVLFGCIVGVVCDQPAIHTYKDEYGEFNLCERHRYFWQHGRYPQADQPAPAGKSASEGSITPPLTVSQLRVLDRLAQAGTQPVRERTAQALIQRGLIALDPAVPIKQRYFWPCYITAAGRQALERERSAGEAAS